MEKEQINTTAPEYFHSLTVSLGFHRYLACFNCPRVESQSHSSDNNWVHIFLESEENKHPRTPSQKSSQRHQRTTCDSRDLWATSARNYGRLGGRFALSTQLFSPMFVAFCATINIGTTDAASSGMSLTENPEFTPQGGVRSSNDFAFFSSGALPGHHNQRGPYLPRDVPNFVLVSEVASDVEDNFDTTLLVSPKQMPRLQRHLPQAYAGSRKVRMSD